MCGKCFLLVMFPKWGDIKNYYHKGLEMAFPWFTHNLLIAFLIESCIASCECFNQIVDRKLYNWGCRIQYLQLQLHQTGNGTAYKEYAVIFHTPQKKKRPTSFADELAARIKGEVLVKEDEDRSCKLTLKFWYMIVKQWDTPESVGQETLCNNIWNYTDLFLSMYWVKAWQEELKTLL